MAPPQGMASTMLSNLFHNYKAQQCIPFISLLKRCNSTKHTYIRTYAHTYVRMLCTVHCFNRLLNGMYLCIGHSVLNSTVAVKEPGEKLSM